MSAPVELSRDEARRFLVRHHGLDRPARARGVRGVRGVLEASRCIQLDPLDAIGTNADLVALARVDGCHKGDVYRALLPGHAFEHFAKERCLLPAAAFPYYRDRAVETPWWRLAERSRKVPSSVLDAVRAEVRERGPITSAALTDHGAVEAMDWSGWKGTGRMTTMALEISWTRCELVVAGRTSGGAKLYDVPERALPAHHDAPAPEPFHRWALLERVRAAGLMSTATGPLWGMLREVRGELPRALVEEGALVEVLVEGSRRRYLARPPIALPRGAPDERLRILGPLDPLVWDRDLVAHAFGFDYVWEVYKPAAQRRWGWYVCPLLHRGHLVGRLEARVADGRLVVDRVWPEARGALDPRALRDALERHAEALGVEPPKRVRVR
ncbi:MAG: YcaQ family DNA glycosylase [Sandaracinaceae bacterium]|nr:YcaQ family DNA glycosylase [Sandaracinaceae bacterium]